MLMQKECFMCHSYGTFCVQIKKEVSMKRQKSRPKKSAKETIHIETWYDDNGRSAIDT